MTYCLTTGDPALRAPHYDMAHFTDERSTPVDTLTHGIISAVEHHSSKAKAFDPSAWWVWAFILLLMAGMGLMAFRMLKKVD